MRGTRRNRCSASSRSRCSATLNAAEAAEIVDLARARGLVVLEAMWTRFLPHMRRIHEILNAGKIGEVRSLTADHRQTILCTG